MSPIKVLLAEDHTIVRKGIRSLLDGVADIEVVGEAEDGREAVEKVGQLLPDVVLMDMSLPKLDGTQATREILKHCPKTVVLMLSAFDYEAYIVASLLAGARGYISKVVPLEKLVSAIRLAYGGHSVLDIEATNRLVKMLPQTGNGENRGSNETHNWLNNRELQVLSLVGRGMSNKEIVDELKVTESTVRAHLVNIYRKLGANSRTQATLHALRKGWIGLNDMHGRID